MKLAGFKRLDAVGRAQHTAAMSTGDKDPKPGHSPSAREARLAKALRENLRRRKAGPGEEPPQIKPDKAER